MGRRYLQSLLILAFVDFDLILGEDFGESFVLDVIVGVVDLDKDFAYDSARWKVAAVVPKTGHGITQ
jgi:hypothetical protein